MITEYVWHVHLCRLQHRWKRTAKIQLDQDVCDGKIRIIYAVADTDAKNRRYRHIFNLWTKMFS